MECIKVKQRLTVNILKLKLYKNSSCQQQSSAVGSSIIGKPDLDTIFRKFMRISRFYNIIALNSCICYLTAYILIGRSNNHAVFWCIVFVLILNDQSFSCKIVGFSFTASSKFNLVSLVISLILNYFNEYHDEKLLWQRLT